MPKWIPRGSKWSLSGYISHSVIRITNWIKSTITIFNAVHLCPSSFTYFIISLKDIDECLNPYVVCGVDSECQNSQGSYRCICKPGFKPRTSMDSNNQQDIGNVFKRISLLTNITHTK